MNQTQILQNDRPGNAPAQPETLPLRGAELRQALFEPPQLERRDVEIIRQIFARLGFQAPTASPGEVFIAARIAGEALNQDCDPAASTLEDLAALMDGNPRMAEIRTLVTAYLTAYDRLAAFVSGVNSI